MLEPSVSDTEVVIPAKIIKLEVIFVLGKIFLCIGNTMGSDEMGTSFSPFTRLRVCIHEYDLSVHLVAVRKGLREGGVEVLPIFGRSISMWRVGHINREVPLCATEFGDKEPRAQQPDRHDCWDQMGAYHDAYS